MTDNVVNLHELPNIIGPQRSGNAVIIEGRKIPHLHARDMGDRIEFVLDERFAIDVPKDIAHTIGWFVANAMAVASGYSFMGAESKDRPFAPQCFGIVL